VQHIQSPCEIPSGRAFFLPKAEPNLLNEDIYFFANSSEKPVDTKVVLRGKKDLAIWNPHTGEREQARATRGEASGQPVTTVGLVLPPVTSLFYIQEQ
jgi:hypothetical protein